MANFIEHTPCQTCGSSDAGASYDDGSWYCHKCGLSGKAQKLTDKIILAPGSTVIYGGTEPSPIVEYIKGGFINGQFQALPLRNISKQTCELYSYRHGFYRGQQCTIADIFNPKTGELTAQKIRLSNKEFPWIGEPKDGGLFGQQICGKGKRLVITEGFEDAMAVSEVFNNKWPAVSIINGADLKGTGPIKELLKHLEYLSNFDEIVLLFDMDESGKISALEAAKGLPMGKVCIGHLPLKDACEMLKANRGSELMAAIWNAKPYRPDGLVSREERIKRLYEPIKTSELLYPFPKLNMLTRGLWPKHITLICGGTGVGKTSLVREICFKFLQENRKIGYIALEEDSADIDTAMIELINSRIILTEEDWGQDDELRKDYINTLFDRLSIYDDHGNMTTDRMKLIIEYMVLVDNCEIIFVDHISMLSMPDGHDINERLVIDQNMTILRTIARRHKIAIVVISHLNRPHSNQGFEEGVAVRNHHLRGSGSLGQIPNTVIAIEGNIYDTTNERKLHVNKCRKRGSSVGAADILCYNKENGRMTVKKEEF